MYTRTKRCYNERSSRTNYIRSSLPPLYWKAGKYGDKCNHSKNKDACNLIKHGYKFNHSKLITFVIKGPIGTLSSLVNMVTKVTKVTTRTMVTLVIKVVINVSRFSYKNLLFFFKIFNQSFNVDKMK